MSEITERLKVAVADRYLIERELGQGGMATVYLAHDVRHDRKVALKVLRPELAAVIGAERFLQEIKVTANLQHSHILPLYDSGSAQGFLFYVMPYVEGETLRTLLNREKQLGVDEAVTLARAVAAALEHAHKQGVIHRDIKPENVLLRDGDPLIADFGIALALSQAGGSRLTETGLSIGTPQYMSPEQAMGDRELNARTDVYSLGAVVYEMLAGDPPYTGSTAQAIVAKVITERAPPVTMLRDTVPPHVAAAIQKALNKLPADRFHSAAEFAQALVSPGMAVETAGTFTGIELARPRRMLTLAGWRLALGLIGAAAVGVAAGVLFTRSDTEPVLSPVRFTIPVRIGDLSYGSGVGLSPDGSQLVFIRAGQEGGSQLYLRRLVEPNPVAIAGTEGILVMHPSLSPDGDRVAFYADQRLRTVSVSGGATKTITGMSPSGGVSWGDGNRIVFQPRFGSGLMVVEAEGGEPRALTVVDSARGPVDHRWPHVLPGGKAVVFTIWRGGLDSARLAVATLDDGRVRELIPGTHPQFVDGGYLVFASREGALRAVRFDPVRGEVRGTPVTVLDSAGVRRDGSAQYSISRSGTLAYLSALALQVPVIARPGAGYTPLPLPAGSYVAPRFRPDGAAIALASEGEIWIYDMTLETFGPLTLDGGFYPLWTPDSKSILFSRDAEASVHVYEVPADRARDPAPIIQAPEPYRTQDLSPDGRHLMLRRTSRSGEYDLWVLSRDSDSLPRPWLETEFLERSPSFSPDGRWVAYSSDESQRDEIYVRAFPGPGGRVQVTTGGGTEPAWSPDGTELYYRTGRRIEAVGVQLRPTFRVLTRPRTVLEGRFFAHPWQRQYDIHPDGRQLVLFQYEQEQTDLTVIVHWMDQHRARLAER